MKYLFIIFISILNCCQPQAQENTDKDGFPDNKSKANYTGNSAITENVYDMVVIDSVADIAKGVNERSPSFIKNRLQTLVGNYLKEKCKQNGLNYPPKFILFRSFKYEQEFEVWAGNSQTDSLRRIFFVKVCAIDNVPGTKLQMGDGKTPEGFYNSALQYGSPNNFMWIKLNNSEIETFGSVGYGSSFKMCLDYPNVLDKKRTNTLLKGKNPGNAICVHANCVTAGCISFLNRNYLPIFLAALSHNSSNYGAIKIHIFPFRFEKMDDKKRIDFASNISDMKKEQVIETWGNLETGYNLFNKTRKALKINISNQTKYTYTTY